MLAELKRKTKTQYHRLYHLDVEGGCSMKVGLHPQLRRKRRLQPSKEEIKTRLS